MDGLNHPWSVVWLTDWQLLISERNGDLLLIERAANKAIKTVLKLPPKINVYAHGQGGLLDLALDPQYHQNGWIYLSYSDDDDHGSTTALARFKITNKRLHNWQQLYMSAPRIDSSHHFGGRIAFDGRYLYLSVGDRGMRSLAQKTDNDIGKILRLHPDGSMAKENPFHNAIYSYGHRNPQGLIYHNGILLAHEHGPRGGDEINVIKKGANYGWPIISHGREYLSGMQVGVGRYKKGMSQPLYHWTPSIAPSGFAYYQGGANDNWHHSLLVGSLKFRQLVRLVWRNNQIVDEERLLTNVFGRIRDVRLRNGNIYLLTDSANGKLIELIAP